MGKGFEGLVLRALRASDYRLTVTGHETVTDHYVRVSFDGNGLLADAPPHPTQWIRLWFPTGADRLHQRGYTLVDADPRTGTFDVEFALHDGPAADWARTAAVGDTIDATVMGSKFALPQRRPSEYLAFGDTASLPAINSLLDAIGDAPARVWIEWRHDSDRTLPVRVGPATRVTWVRRVDGGRLLREAAESVTCDPQAYAWIACDFATTRAVGRAFRTRHGLAREAVKAQAYWK